MSKTLGRRGAVFVVYLLLPCAAGVMFKVVPGGFIPTQDKLYLIGGVKMPEGSSPLARTDAVIRKMSEIGMNTEGVRIMRSLSRGLMRCSSPTRRIPGRSFLA